MRVFLAACVAIIIIAITAYFTVNVMQRPSGIAYTTEGARIDPSWTSRRLLSRTSTPVAQVGMDECDGATTWRWVLVDLSGNAREAPDCP
jgi:hypothetical protein